MRPLRFAAFSLLLTAIGSIASAQHNTRPPRIYDLKNVEWHLSFDETTGTIDGQVTNTVVPLKANTKEVWFDSDKLAVQMATVNGRKAAFRYGKEQIIVTLPKASGPNDTLMIQLNYTGRPEAGIYFIPAKRAFPAHTSVIYTQGEMIDTRYWIPTYDNPDDKTTWDSYVKVPADYTVITNGRLVETKPLPNQMKIVHYRMEQPMSTYLMSLITGKYDRVPDGTFGKTPVMWNVPDGLDEMGKNAFGGTDKMIEVYSKQTGFNYPYAKFEQSAVPDYMFGGMENITAVTQTINALFPNEAAPVINSEGLILHELAHQWFGDTVTCASWSHAWLNEGFATFLPSFYVRAAHGQDEYDLSRYGTLQGGYFSTMGEKRPVVWSGYQEPIDEFGGSVYPGGATRLFWLMYTLGEDKFWHGITDYLNKYKYTPVTTEQFFASMTKSTGVNLDTFRKQWLYTASMPQITVKRSGSDLLIDQKAPYFDLHLPVWILDGTKWVKKSVFSNGAEAKLPLGDLAGKPVLVDPEVYLGSMIRYDYPIPAKDYMTMYRNAPNAAAKARLQETMDPKLSAEQTLELCKEEKNEQLWERMIGGVTDESYLLEVLNGDDAKMVNIVAGNPSDGKISSAMEARLRELADHHANIIVRQTATRTILRNGKDDVLAEKAWNLPSYNEGFRIAALYYYNQNDKDKARELCLGVLANPDSEDLRQACIQMLGGLKDKPNDRRVFKALVKVVQERSFGARNDAINALASYGDKAALQYIQPLTTNSMVFTRRAAQGAVQQLGG